MKKKFNKSLFFEGIKNEYSFKDRATSNIPLLISLFLFNVLFFPVILIYHFVRAFESKDVSQ